MTAFVKSVSEAEKAMRALFPDIPEAFDNTIKIAEQCNVEFEFGNIKLPRFEAPGGDSTVFFRKLCYEGLTKRYGEHPDNDIVKRLEYEMSTIERMGYVDYYLIVYDFISYAKKNGIPVGPGRGSGAASLCAYCIGITGIDPIKYNLLFERFLNPERVSMPDFDIDFCNEKRQLVIDYVIDKYGSDHVAQIITFGTMAARAAIRDVARAMGLPYALADRTAKLIPWELGMTIKKAVNQSPQLSQLAQSDEQVNKLLNMAKRVEGMPRHASTHAAGVVITDRPVSDYVPLCLNGELIATQYPMNILEELGLLKMDFLGLRTLTIIKDALKLVKERHGIDINPDEIGLEDTKTYQLFKEGRTIGIFQYESPGMQKYMRELKPTVFADLIAMNALYRPGPIKYIPNFINRKHGIEEIVYDLPETEEYLKETYGITVYQEQVMLLSQKLANFTKGEADVLRKAMGKKQTNTTVNTLAEMPRPNHRIVSGIQAIGAIGRMIWKIGFR